MLLHLDVGSHFTQIGRRNITPKLNTNAFVWLNFIQSVP
jgi:hypothetical protein